MPVISQQECTVPVEGRQFHRDEETDAFALSCARRRFIKEPDMFRLRFPENQITHWASRNSDSKESEIETRIAPAARARGYLTRDEFLAICRWKTPRSKHLCERNRESFVKEVTRVALSTGNEERKIRILLTLKGVGWPTASVILHFCDQARYPILDYRALWSLGITKPPTYTFAFWTRYCAFLRELADRTGLDMRTVDRGLWQFSKENQRA